MNLNKDFRKSLRYFIYFYTNGTLPMVTGESRLIKIDYREVLKEMPGIVETMFAVYSNNIDINEEGMVINHEYAMKRATHFLLASIDQNYQVNKEFEDWELDLY